MLRSTGGFCLVLALAVAGCGDSEEGSSGSGGAFAGPADGLPASCHPFRASGSCALPFPSNHFVEDDASTTTGKRIAFVSDAFPGGAEDGNPDPVPFDPARFNQADGFSWATPLLAYFEEKIDPDSLPPQTDFEKSLDPSSATLILDLESGEFFPHFSEVDLSANISDSDRQPIMLRPARHFLPDHRYAVAVTSSVRTRDGVTPARPAGFESAMAGATSDDPVVKKSLETLPGIVEAFAAAGVERDDLLVAWDFNTASIGSVMDPVLSMRDDTLAMIGEDGLGYRIDSVELDPNQEIHKRVRGVFMVPSFLEHDDRTVAENGLVFGDDGLPEIQRVAEYPFDLMIPNSAVSNGPLPLVYYGHGLLGEALDGFQGELRQFCDRHQFIAIGTDFIGLSHTEDVGFGGSAAALFAIKNVSNIWWLSDRLMQGQMNRLALVRTAKRILADPQTFAEPPTAAPFEALADPFEVYYYGISQGAIFGASFMAMTPDIDRAVLQVGASGFSLFVQRSSNWPAFFPAIRNGYPDRVDQQLSLALWQPALDFAEGSGTAWAQGVHDPLPGAGPKSLLFQNAVGDSQVPNIGSDIQARTLGIPLVVPSARDVWGLETTEGGTDHAIVFYDLMRTPPPMTNETPETDNDVHGDIRKLDANMLQTAEFLRTGKVTNTCGGACVFPDG